MGETENGHLADLQFNYPRVSFLDILWSDLITLPIHQRVSVPANCPLIVPGVSIVTREDLSSQLLSIANIPQISPSLVRKERKGKRKIPLQYSFRMAASVTNHSAVCTIHSAPLTSEFSLKIQC